MSLQHGIMSNQVAPGNSPVLLSPLKERQRATWASGDYAVIGTGLQLVSELLCEAADVHAGERVLDVATGHGNTALAAARRGAHVIGVDYVPALLLVGQERARAERLAITWVEGDAEALPFEHGSFDVVLSTFGTMFAPSHEQTANELLRVCSPGGTIGLCNWTPASMVGELFRVLSDFIPPPPGLVPPSQWGDRAYLATLFGGGAEEVRVTERVHAFRARSARELLDTFQTFYGPVHKAFAALDGERQYALATTIERMFKRLDRGGDRGLVVPSEYAEVVIRRG